jgi:hypothetical protein
MDESTETPIANRYGASWVDDSTPLPEMSRVLLAREDVEGRKRDEELAASREAAGEARMIVARSLGYQAVSHNEVIERARAQMELSEKLQERERDEYGRRERLAPEPSPEDVARDAQRAKRYLGERLVDRRIHMYRNRQHDGPTMADAWNDVLRRAPRERFERSQREHEADELAIAQRMVAEDRAKREKTITRTQPSAYFLGPQLNPMLSSLAGVF